MSPKKYSILLLTFLILPSQMSSVRAAEEKKSAGQAPPPPQPAQQPQPPPPGPQVAPGVYEIGRIANPTLNECSGVVASRQYPEVFWAHSDGGGIKRQILYAITRTGKSRAEFRVANVRLSDWEDIAIDNQHHLYIADTGNNENSRTTVFVHQLNEPNPAMGRGVIEPQRSWHLNFPNQPFDSEGLFVWKDSGYLVSKVQKDVRAEIYEFSLTNGPAAQTLRFVARTKIESPVAGADISPDGKLLALIAKSGAFVFEINGDITRAHKEKGYQTKFHHDRTEGICFVPEGALCTAESREIYLFTDPPFRGD